MAYRDFDVIILGASGFTGRYVIEELTKTVGSTGVKWAIAGRNVQKLKESLEIVQEYIGENADLRNITIIKADIEDAVSISDMCKRGKLILNCVGPYRFYGEVVVKACIEAGTHHVDLSAEIPFLETMQIKYFKKAREKGVYIVQACGFGSIPGDYGISLLKKEFPGDLNAVEYFVEIETGPEGRNINVGTLKSVIHILKDILNTKQYSDDLKKEVFKKEIIRSNCRLSKRFPLLFYSEEEKAWCLWFLGPDERVIHRSQQFRYEYLNERPVQSNGYIRWSSFYIALHYLLFAGLFALLSMFSLGRYLLVKYPSFFTAGEFSTEGPTRKQLMERSSKFTLYGTGWSDKLAEPTDQHTTQPNKKMKLTICGPDPGYVLTSMCMVQAGLTILEENDKLPLEGGVLTPGVAFENTSLRQRLEKRGMNFTFETIN